MRNISSKDIMLFIIIVAMVIVPITVKVAIVGNSNIETALFGSTLPDVVDVFSFYKSRFITFFSVLIAMLFINEAVNFLTKGSYFDYKRFIKNPLNLAMIVFITLVLLSTVTSPYMEIAIKGTRERYENIFVIIGYCLFMYGVIYSVETEKRAFYVLYGIFASAFIIGIIGLMQFFGKDPFSIEGVQDFLLGGNKEYIENFSIGIPTIYSTLYNPNCAGMYGAMMFMITASLAALLPVKSIFKYVSALLTSIMSVIVVGSYSLAGIIGVFAGIFAFIVIYVVYLVSHKDKMRVEVIVAAIALVAVLAVFTQTTYFKSSLEALAHKANWSMLYSEDNKFYNYIRVLDNYIEVSTSNDDFFLEYDSESKSVAILDSEKNIIIPEETSYNEEEGKYTARYNFGLATDLFIEFYNNVISFDYFGIFLFGLYSNGDITAITPAGYAFDINTPIPSLGFEDSQSVGNGRGYLWSKSFPLMFRNILLGKGPDSFIIQFPQHDVVGKANFFKGDSNIIVDKPHNTYIQYAVNTGLVSMIAIVFVFTLYLLNTIMLVAKSTPHALLTPMQIGIFSGIFAYLVVSLSTDSTVSVAPVFWCVLGLGFAINNMKIKYFKEV